VYVLHVAIGAFGFSGKYIAKRLLDRGHRVRTMTNGKKPVDPFQAKVEIHPLAFGDDKRLVESLKGATVFYNTYGVRFNHAKITHSGAIDNTLRLFAAAKAAGVERIVHISIANPSEDSGLGYLVCSVIGKLVGDVFLTRDEIKGLMADLLYVDAKPAGSTRLTEWAHKHSASLGREYASELARRLT
jgi:hypothetical protein